MRVVCASAGALSLHRRKVNLLQSLAGRHRHHLHISTSIHMFPYRCSGELAACLLARPFFKSCPFPFVFLDTKNSSALVDLLGILKALLGGCR